jgi:hypothetical protein
MGNWKVALDSSDELEPGHQPNPDKLLAIHGRTIVVLTSARSNVEPGMSVCQELRVRPLRESHERVGKSPTDQRDERKPDESGHVSRQA